MFGDARLPVLQMPTLDLASEQVGPRLYRKQILKVGEIPYKGKRLRFDHAYLQKAVESFNAGAFDSVPFVLADAENRHTSDPERFRGEVKALELNGDGIDALVELTEEGAEVVRKNPRLGVSARLVPDREKDGKVFPVAIEHVCGTLNPRVNGLRPWETDSVRSLSQSSEQKVIDLSTADYMSDKNSTTITDEQLDELKGLTPEERAAKLGEFTQTPEKDEGKKFSLKGLLGIKDDKITDEDLHEAISALEEEEESDDRTPAAASLSDDDKRRIDLAEEQARKADERVAAAEWKTERTELASAGVPPAMLDLAEPILKSGREVVIDLSDDQKADASEVIRKLLDQAKGTVDLSDAKGSGEDTQDRFSDDDWKASV